ncbi:MAG: alpha/beta hydrolase [Rhodocyclaceae bacterium]|nr:alpha/beta hydrolase [Rhodocyclaceae bacterium]
MFHCPSSTEQISVRGLRYCIRHWGDPNAPIVFFLHGRMDSSATFQFVVDALKTSWHVIAPDWRGYGQTQWLSRPYCFPDYLADLHCILAHYTQDPVRLVGHSMGANIASTYAGLRPQQVSQLVMMDFVGLARPSDTDGTNQLNQWLTAIQTTPEMRGYDGPEVLARQMMSVNHRLTAYRAEILSLSVSYVRPDGLLAMACDPWHKIPSPTLYRVEDSMASWQRITAPVLMLIADQGFVHHRFANCPEELLQRLGCFNNHLVVNISDAGHNIQHDQPEQVASALDQFLTH